MESLNRKASVFFFYFLLVGSFVQAQEELNVLQKNWVHFSDAPNALYKHFASQAYEQLEARKKKIDQLQTLDDWKGRQQWLKERFAKVLGSFPEKTALNAKTIRTVDKEDYRVEHIVFESQPGFYVSSSLFIPLGVKGKLPVIIYCSGHAAAGYRSRTYQ